MEKGEMKKLVETQKFAGETIDVYRYLPDYLVKINNVEFGFYTSPAAGINSAQQSIIRKLDEAKK